MICGTSAAITSAVCFPALRTCATYTRPFFGTSCTCASAMLASPAFFRKPWIAASGAPSFGPITSSTTSADFTGRPSTTATSLRGPEKPLTPSGMRPAAVSPSISAFTRSASAFACMRAGISSDRISSRSWGIAGSSEALFAVAEFAASVQRNEPKGKGWRSTLPSLAGEVRRSRDGGEPRAQIPQDSPCRSPPSPFGDFPRKREKS